MPKELNLSLYPPAVSEVIGLDPSPKLLARARAAKSPASYSLGLVNGSAEAIPLDTGSVDTAVTSWTLCSIPDIARALHEVRRVLRADGRLLFVEHGRSPDTKVAGWQDRLTPVWKEFAGGCRLNRPMGQLIEQSGFRSEQLHTAYMTGPKLMTFMYEGVARPVLIYGAGLLLTSAWPEVRPFGDTLLLVALGAACAVNFSRNRTVHCGITGPLFLLGAVAAALIEAGTWRPQQRLRSGSAH